MLKKSKHNNEIKTEYLLAQRIVTSSGILGEDVLLSDIPPQAAFGYKNKCIMKPREYIVLDFGEEICGGIEITFHFSEVESSKMRVVFGESVSEAMSELGVKNSTNDHSPRDVVVTTVNYSNIKDTM